MAMACTVLPAPGLARLAGRLAGWLAGWPAGWPGRGLAEAHLVPQQHLAVPAERKLHAWGPARSTASHPWLRLRRPLLTITHPCATIKSDKRTLKTDKCVHLKKPNRMLINRIKRGTQWTGQNACSCIQPVAKTFTTASGKNLHIPKMTKVHFRALDFAPTL